MINPHNARLVNAGDALHDIAPVNIGIGQPPLVDLVLADRRYLLAGHGIEPILTDEIEHVADGIEAVFADASAVIQHPRKIKNERRVTGQKLQCPHRAVLQHIPDLTTGHALHRAAVGHFLRIAQIGSDDPAGDVIDRRPDDAALVVAAAVRQPG